MRKDSFRRKNVEDEEINMASLTTGSLTFVCPTNAISIKRWWCSEIITTNTVYNYYVNDLRQINDAIVLPLFTWAAIIQRGRKFEYSHVGISINSRDRRQNGYPKNVDTSTTSDNITHTRVNWRVPLSYSIVIYDTKTPMIYLCPKVLHKSSREEGG